MTQMVNLDTLQKDDIVSWAAYHAAQQPADSISETNKAITALLPLFHEQAKSVAMIRHSMDIVKRAVELLNPGQVPVIAVDQPLYTVAKQIQWSWPRSHGEQHFVIMFGGLHIEMAILKTLGDLLDSSGWTSALVEAGIASTGTADSFLKASHVTCTRRAHQVTASALYLLSQKAYAQYSSNQNEKDLMSLEDWKKKQVEISPQFHFWHLILQLQLQYLIFVRAVREANFLLYFHALTKIVPWFFALDHTNYARWIPVHLRDMTTLEASHPDVFTKFMQGHFTVKKTLHRFSAIAIDHAHEQNNSMVKGDGGAVGLTENASALRRWMVSGPEMARVIGEFEDLFDEKGKADTRHHEQTQHTQQQFLKDVHSLTDVIEQMGNPFTDETGDLLVLDTRDLASAAVIHTVKNVEKVGQEQYAKYVEERLENRTTSMMDPIKRNNLPCFRQPKVQEKSKSQLQLSSLKNDCSLFSRLYIASQTSNKDLDEFFEHENQAFPPALSQNGKIRSGVKSQLINCLEELVDDTDTTTISNAEVIILDAAAIVNMLRPGSAKTFDDYATQVFLPYISSQLNQASRVDVVWDEYLTDSLKAGTRTKRGKGVRRRVEPSARVPQNWNEFLRIDENKIELFTFLAHKTAKMDTTKQVISTHHSEVLCVKPRDTTGLAPCNHEEADTRMMLHVEDAVKQGYNKVMVRTVDTDVVVLAVNTAQRLNICELWVAFGTGKHFRFIPSHAVARKLGPDRSMALPMFHAFTGCDNVSFFSGVGKRTAWATWKAFEEITPAFCALSATPESMEEWLHVLERFVVLLYDRNSSEMSINQARKQLFTQKNRTVDHIPPTKAALLQHCKRAIYQAGHCWGQLMVATPELPSPSEWGWTKSVSGGWDMFWTSLPEASEACRQLIRCACKKGCRGQCKCIKEARKCTLLCACGGECTAN